MHRLVWSVVAAAAVSSFALSPLRAPALASGSPFMKANEKRKNVEPIRARPVRISDNFGKSGLHLRSFPDTFPRPSDFRIPADAGHRDFAKARTASKQAFATKPRSTQQVSNALRTFRNDKKVAPFTTRFSIRNRSDSKQFVRTRR